MNLSSAEFAHRVVKVKVVCYLSSGQNSPKPRLQIVNSLDDSLAYRPNVQLVYIFLPAQKTILPADCKRDMVMVSARESVCPSSRPTLLSEAYLTPKLFKGFC